MDDVGGGGSYVAIGSADGGLSPDNIDNRCMQAVERVYDLIDREWPTVCRVARNLIVRASL